MSDQDIETGPLLLKPSEARPTRWYRQCMQLSALLELVLVLLCAGSIAASAYMGADWLIGRLSLHGAVGFEAEPQVLERVLDDRSECCSPECDPALPSTTLWSHSSETSLHLECPTGQTLQCLVSAGFVAKASAEKPSSLAGLRDMYVPRRVWNEDCLGESQCELNFERGGDECQGRVEGEAVRNHYFSTVNGEQMEALPDTIHAQCVAVGIRVVALCEQAAVPT